MSSLRTLSFLRRAGDASIRKKNVPTGLPSSGTGIGSSTQKRFAGSNTKPKFLHITKEITTGHGSRTLWKWAKLPAAWPSILAPTRTSLTPWPSRDDLGHTPFGHAGEHSLQELMADKGGFEHNSQSLRVVDVLEARYPDFPGLNLTYETRAGIIRHSTVYDQAPEHVIKEFMAMVHLV